MEAAKRGLNDAKVVAFWCVKSLSTKKVAKLEASCCLPPTPTPPPYTLSLFVCLSDLCRFAWLCLDWAQQLQLSPALNVGVYLNKLKLVISQRTEIKKKKVENFLG